MAKNKLLEEKIERFHLAKEAVDERIPDWNEKDELYLGHIDKTKVVTRARVTDSVPFRLVIERAARTMANKPRGHYTPREGGDLVAARILDTISDYYWDNANHGGSMVYKWWITALGALKYGTAFALVPYWFERRVIREKQGKEVKFKKIVKYDGPEFIPLNLRDCFPDPSATNINNCKYFITREYMTLDQLEAINNASVGDPVYQNLDKLREAVSKGDEGFGDKRDINYQSRSKSIRGVEDYTGKEKGTPVFEILTERTPERWVTFSEKHNVILRDIPNPLYSGDIPIIALNHYPMEDDLYGLGELEPIKRLLKASSALINQALDETNMKLYSPLKIDPTKVEVSTIKYAAGAKWIVSDMNAIQEHIVQSKFVQHFVPTYSFIISAIQNAAGTTDFNINQTQARSLGETATGTRFIAQQQNNRDNLFRTFLEDQIRRMQELWLQYIQQYTDKPRVLRVAGQEAMEFFAERFPDAVEKDGMFVPNEVELDKGKSVPKFNDMGEIGFLAVTPEDIIGDFDYIPEVGSTQDYDPSVERNNLVALYNIVSSPQATQALAAEQTRIKASELFKELFFKFNVKNPERFFEDVQEVPQEGQMLGGMPGQPVPQEEPVQEGMALPNTNPEILNV